MPDAIRSALGQTHPHLEIVVVDDGSTDHTAEVTAQFPQVHCVRQENQGRARARNAGFRASTGEYVLFVDADDRLTPNAVETHLSCFARHSEAGFVVGDIDQIASDGSYFYSPRWPVLEANFYEELLKVNHVANTIGVMFRRPLLDDLGGFISAFEPAEDYEILLRAARLSPSAHHSNVVAQYRRHTDNTSRKGAVMLRAIHRVMRSQYPFTRKDPSLSRALRRGENYWREHYGAVTVKEIWRNLAHGDLRHVAPSAAALIWHVRGRLVLLPWKYRGHILRAVRRCLGRTEKQQDGRASSIPGS